MKKDAEASFFIASAGRRRHPDLQISTSLKEEGRSGVLYSLVSDGRHLQVSTIKNGGIEPPFFAFGFDITSRFARC
jgi:hypothetical protein